VLNLRPNATALSKSVAGLRMRRAQPYELRPDPLRVGAYYSQGKLSKKLCKTECPRIVVWVGRSFDRRAHVSSTTMLSVRSAFGETWGFRPLAVDSPRTRTV
jgi:hypothetical protein